MQDVPVARVQGFQAVWILRLLRPRQWIKNGFVLAPLVFAGLFLQTAAIEHALVAMLLFCIGSSAAYVVNDVFDHRRDRLHPTKSKTRPVAAGLISVRAALIVAGVLYGLLAVAWAYVPDVVAIVVAYLMLNLAYTVALKRQPVVDIFVIAIGFVLRVVAGGVAIGVPVSSWMFITTLCLALYLAAVKRRQELKHGAETREVLQTYSVALVERYAEISATGALVFYSMFVLASRPALVISIPLVLFGLFRYWYVVEAREEGESPTDALLADWQLCATVVLWIASCAWALWPMARG